jgi:hypothetical protein
MAIPGADSNSGGGDALNGLAKVKSDAIAVSARLAMPLLAISQGAKVSAVALGMVKGALIGKVLGPLALVSGAATGLMASLKVLVTVFGKLGLEGAAGLERLEKSFQPLLRSATLARQRVKELAAFSKVTPFKSESIMAANRSLELFTKGAYSGIRAMKLIGDVAAHTGNDITDVGEAVGKVYGEIQNGAPLGRAIRQLVNMGAISAETAERVENLKNAGVGAGQVWKVMEQDLQRSSGAMAEMGNTLAGLQGRYESAKAALLTGFGKGFMAGEKKGLEAMIGAMQALTPVAEHFGGMFGTVHQGFEAGSAGIVKFVSKIKFLPEVLKWVGDGAVALIASISALSMILIGKFIVSIVAATGALGVHAAAQRVTAGATALYTGVVEKLIAMLKALATANFLAAGSEAKQAGAMFLSASAADRKGAALILLGKAAKWVGNALLMVGRAVFNLARGLIATPIGLAVTALTALSVIGYRLYETWKKNKEALEAFKQATRDANREFERQYGLMKTLADKAELYRKAVDRVIEAEKKLAEARKSGDKDKIRAAQWELEDAQKNRETVKNSDDKKLALTPEENERQRERQKVWRDPNNVATKAAYDAEMAEQDKTRAALANENINREDLKKSIWDDTVAIGKQRGLQRDAKSKQGVAGKHTPGWNEAERQRVAAKAEEERLVKERDKKQKRYDSGGEIMRNSGSTVMREQAVLDELYQKRDAQANYEAAAALHKKINEAKDSDLAGLTGDSLPEDLNAALRAGDKKKAVSIAGARESSFWDENLRVNKNGQVDYQAIQEQENRVADLRDNKFNDSAVKQAEDARQAAGWDEKRANLEKQIASLRDEGFETALREHELKQRQVDMEIQAIDANKNLLNEEKAAAKANQEVRRAANDTALANARKEAELRKAAAMDEFQLSKATREMREARRKGDTKGYAKAEKENEEVAARQRERELRQEAKGMEFSSEEEKEGWIKSRMDEFRQQQAQDRAEREEGEKNQRDDTERGGKAQVLQLRANILRKQGDTEGAKALDEQAAQIMDESKRRDLVKEYRGAGMTAEEAQRHANNQIDLDRANRELDRAENTKGTEVASSMAAIGGGGGVYSTDPAVAKLDRSNELLKQIAANTGVSIDNRNREE